MNMNEKRNEKSAEDRVNAGLPAALRGGKSCRNRVRLGLAGLCAIGMLMLPQMCMETHAEPTPKKINGGSAVLEKVVNTNDMQIVDFAGVEWYVIGYNTSGNKAAKPGRVTLFAKVNIDDDVPFKENGNNVYKNSTLANFLNSAYSAFSDVEKAAVESRNLEGGSELCDLEGYNDNKVAGDDVTVKLWALSVAEANDLPSDTVRSASDFWWLRSPGCADCLAADVGFNGDVCESGTDVYGSHGARPAFYLNLDSILFTSAASGGKDAGSVIGTLNQVDLADSNREWKLTLIDSGRSEFRASRVGDDEIVPGEQIHVSFHDAGSGSGEYVSAVLVQRGAENRILYYGHIAGGASSDAVDVPVTIPDSLDDGDYILKIFSEKINTGNHAVDVASNPNSNTIEFRVGEGGEATDDDDYSSGSRKSRNKKVTTPFEDYDYAEIDGKIVFGGLVEDVFSTTTMIPAWAYPKFNNFMAKKLGSAESGDTITVNADPWTSMNKTLADAFTAKGDVALALIYTPGYQVTIPAETNLSELLDANGYIGFSKLSELFGTEPVVEEITQ